MTTITIDRAIVEQALHVAENAGYPLALIKALRAALAQQAEPVNVAGPAHLAPKPAPGLEFDERGVLVPQQTEPVAWLRVIDEAMVTHHLGVADPGDDYETAKRKMNNLLCMAQDIGTYFAKQAEPVEPVAWCSSVEFSDALKYAQSFNGWRRKYPKTDIPLYTAPPQRKPLTDQEIDRIRADCVFTPHEYRDRAYGWALHFARAIERAHGIGGQE